MIFAAAAAAALLFLLLVARSALNNLSPVALSQMAEEKAAAARMLQPFLERKPAFLLTLQAGLLGATVALVLSLERVFHDGASGGGTDVAGGLAGIAGAGVLVVVAHLVAAWDPPRALAATLPILTATAWLFWPVTAPLGWFLGRMIDAWEARVSPAGQETKEEEIAALLDVGEREGILEGEDSVLIEGVLSFGDTVVREVMTPRTDMVCAEAGTTVKAAVELLARTRHTRLPLYEGQVDNVVGVVYVKELLGPLLEGREREAVRAFMRPVPFVPESKAISKLLREFQEAKVQLAIVVDEYGGVDGLVTSEDLLEEIVGEIQESDEAEEAPVRVVGPGCVEVLGRAPVYDLAEALGVSIREGDFDSVAGWVIQALGTIPHTGHRATLEGLEVEVLHADRKRIHRLRVSRPHPSDAQAPEETREP